MASSFIVPTSELPRPTKFDVFHFLAPQRTKRRQFSYVEERICAIIPTYAPGMMTLRLVQDLTHANPLMTVCIVDDCTPLSESHRRLLRRISAASERVVVLRTPSNALKAGALNYALAYLSNRRHTIDVILTLDDDVVVAPTTIAGLWRQRIRWSYGGIRVVSEVRRPLAVFQDILGHTLFLSTLGTVAALYFLKGEGHVPAYIANWIIVLSFAQLGIWYSFQLWLMKGYEEKDFFDWIIRLSLLPEFVYSYLMTFALLGSYIFYSFNVFASMLHVRSSALARGVMVVGREVFGWLGYAEGNWGTRLPDAV